MKNNLRPVLLLAASALVLTACGSDGLSKDDYTSQAEGICTQLKQDLEDVEAPATPEAFSAFYDQTLDTFSSAIDQLKELDPPGDDADKIKDGLTEPLTEQVDALRGAQPEIEEALSSDNPQEAFDEIQNPIEEAGEDAKVDKDFLNDYGLSTCASASN